MSATLIKSMDNEGKNLLFLSYSHIKYVVPGMESRANDLNRRLIAAEELLRLILIETG